MCQFASFAQLYTMSLDEVLNQEQEDFLNAF